MTPTRATKPGKPNKANMTGILLGAGAGVVIVLLLVAVLLGSNEADSEYGEPTIDGQGLILMPAQVKIDTSATGSALPTVIGEDFDGSAVEIRNDDGRAKAIVLLAHWCPHCQAEVPAIQQWLDETGGVDGVDIYTVSSAASSARANYPPSAWLDGEGWTLPVLKDDADNSVYVTYGAGAFPFVVYANADGTVALRSSGELGADELQSILESLQK